MKEFIIFLFFVFFGFQASAVETKFCPQRMSLELSEVQVFSKSFIKSQMDDLIGRFSPIFFDDDSNQYFLEKNFTGFSLSLELKSTEKSVCTYQEQGTTNSRYRVVISGTDADPILLIDYFLNDVFVNGLRTDVSYRMFADIITKRPFYNLEGSTLQIKTFASYRTQGENFIDYVSVGKGVFENNFIMSDYKSSAIFEHQIEPAFYIRTQDKLKEDEDNKYGSGGVYEVTEESYKALNLNHFLFTNEDKFVTSGHCYVGDPAYTIDLISKIIRVPTDSTRLTLLPELEVERGSIVIAFYYVPLTQGGGEGSEVFILRTIEEC